MRKALVASLVGATLIGVAAMAQAKSPVVHQIDVAVPGGGVATIRYMGDVAPRIGVSNNPVAIDAFAPVVRMFGRDSAFVQINRVSAAMDRQAAAMLQQAETLMAMPYSNMPLNAAFAPLLAGSESYSVNSTSTGTGMCTRSVQITYQGNKSHVVSSSTGKCYGSSMTQIKPASNAMRLNSADAIQASAMSYAHSRKVPAEPS